MHPGAPHGELAARALPRSGSIVISSERRVLSLTPGLPALMAHCAIARVEGAVLCFLDARYDELIHTAVHRDPEHGESAECCGVFELPDGGTLKLTASRLDLLESDPSAAPNPHVLVTVAVMPPRQVFPALFVESGLTPAEQEIALAYAHGGSIRSISLDRGRAIETIRTHLKTAMSKLGVHRQVDLALIVARVSEPD